MAQFTRFVVDSQYFRLMSSHHFVKEGQEPLLFVLGVNETSRKMLDQLLSWSPRLVVAEKAISKMEQWGIKMDEVHVSGERIESWKSSLDYQWPIDVLAVASNDLNMSLNKLIREEGNQEINVLTGFDFEALTDVFIELIPFTSLSTIRVFGSDYEVFPVTKDSERFFPKETELMVYGDGQVELDGTINKTVNSGVSVIIKNEGRLRLLPHGRNLWMARKLNFSF